MNNNKTTTYLIYAIGEIILVVVGILIAVSIDDWNQNREDRVKEIEILKGLNKDFKSDIMYLNISKVSYEKLISSSDILLNQLTSPSEYHDSLDYHFAIASLWPKAIVHTNSFEVLKSIGLDIISNDSLRNEILNHHSIIYSSLKTWEEGFDDYYYAEEMLLRRFDKFEPWYIDEQSIPRYGLMKPLNYKKLKTDTLYQSILRSRKSKASTLLNGAYKEIIENTANLIEAIDEHLEFLERRY